MTTFQQGGKVVVTDEDTIDEAQASGRWIGMRGGGVRVRQ